MSEKYKTVKLGDVCEAKQASDEISERTWILNLDKIEPNTGKILEYEYANRSELGQSICQFNESNVLYSKLRPYLNKVVVPQKSGVATSELVPLFPNKNIITREYLADFLRSDSFVSLISEKVAGAKMPRVVMKDFYEIKLPLPPLAEQKHIAAVLDKCSEVIEKHKTMLAKYDTLIKSRFIEMFGDPVTNPMGWEVKPLSEVAPAKPSNSEITEKVWLLNLDMVESQTGKIIDYLIVDKNEIGNSTYQFDEENVLYSKLRPYLNKVVTPKRAGFCTSELVPLRPVKLLNKYFLADLLRSNSFVNFINEKVAGAKMPRVSMEVFRAFPCILPPLALQQEFAAFVRTVDAQKSAVQKSLEKAETLYKSLMQEYFS